VHGYTKHSDEAASFGRLWVSELRRGTERIRITIKRTG